MTLDTTAGTREACTTRMNKLVLTLVVLAAYSQLILAEQIFAVGWPSQAYSIDAATAVAHGIGTVSPIAVNDLSRSPAGVLYTINSTNLLTIDPVTGAGTLLTPINLHSAESSYISVSAMAFSPAGVLYLINRDEASPFPSDRLFTLDVNTGQGQLVGLTGLTPHMQGLACAANGTLYGWHTQVGLVTINTNTGIAIDVNAAVGATADLQCLGFSSNGNLYGARMALYILNVNDGVASLIGGTLADIRGLQFIPSIPVARPELSIFRTPTVIRVCTMTQGNQTYQLEYLTGLESTNAWARLGPAFSGTGAEICMTNPVSAKHQFYRLAVTGP
jgi:hypothetical protein